MNMLLHGIRTPTSARTTRSGDRSTWPTSGELTRFDRVIANPPVQPELHQEGHRSSRALPRAGMPEKGKKADLMFVQHMLAVLKSDGSMATVMPHGVLFRGGEEKRGAPAVHRARAGSKRSSACRPNLFYGTGIPACVLVINKDRRGRRAKHVLFINADREYREGKAQNFLRPEDIEKIIHVYRERRRRRRTTPALVPVEEIEAKDFNCNIRRYVDNAPPPEPHDVRAHLHGGVPVGGDRCARRASGTTTPDCASACFAPRRGQTRRLCSTSRRALADRRAPRWHRQRRSPSVAAAHGRVLATLEAWWHHAPAAHRSAGAGRRPARATSTSCARLLLGGIERAFAEQRCSPITRCAARFARLRDLKADLKSIAASGWGAGADPGRRHPPEPVSRSARRDGATDARGSPNCGALRRRR